MISVTEYQAALRDYDRAAKHLAAVALRLREIGRELEARPGASCFAAIEGEEQPPLTGLLTEGRRWREEDYPSAAQVQAAVRARHETRQRLHELWALLPDEDRIGLSAPLRN